MEVLQVIGRVLLFLVLGFVLFMMYKFVRKHVAIKEVKEGERLIVYRRGRFHRILTPGWHWIWSDIDRIERRYVVREEVKRYPISDIFVHGIPFGLTISFWSKFDPQRAYEEGKIDREGLVGITLFNQYELEQQITWKVRQVFIECLAQIEASSKLSSNALMEEKLLPIISGTPVCKDLLKNVENRLKNALPALGIFLSPAQEVTIENIRPPEEIVKGFSLNRLFDLLDKVMPGLSDEDKMHIMASVEEWPGFKQDRLHINGSGRVSIRRRDGETETRVYAGEPPVSNHDEASLLESDTVFAGDESREWLRDEDLSYLKRLPRTV